MRIAYLTREFAVRTRLRGGLGNYLDRVTRGLAARGHEIHVILLGPRRETFERDGVLIHCRPVWGIRERGGRTARPSGRGGRLLRLPQLASHAFNWLAGPQVWRALTGCAHVAALHRRHRFDLVQVPSAGGQGLFCSFLACPCVCFASSYRRWTIEASGIPCPPDLRITERLEVLSMRLADSVYATSGAVAGRLRRREGVARVEVIHPPLAVSLVPDEDSIRLRELRGRPYLLFYGQMGPLKGADLLARALTEVLGEIPDMHVVFVGGDRPMPDGSSTRAAVEGMLAPWRDRAHVWPRLDHRQLFPLIRHARLVVLPSLADNLPNACLEAMGLGRPVLGAEGASFEEMIADGIDGFLFPCGDVAALAGRIREVWRRDDLGGIGAAAARKVREMFDPERSLSALESLYHRVLSGRRGRDPVNEEA